MSTPRTIAPNEEYKPVYAVWELTLRCDHACAHCGSRAAPDATRDDELSTRELLDVAAELVRLGTREVTVIGGEAYLRKEVYDVVAFLAERGVRVTMQTGGMGLTKERAERFRAAGLSAVGVSVDGPEAVHDELRARPGSHRGAMRALRVAREAGLITSANTQINRLNQAHLRDTALRLRDEGAAIWRTQLTVPMGRAADHPEWILEPWAILEVIDTLAAIQVEVLEDARARGIPLDRAFRVQASNNVGYFGPHEQLLRSHPGRAERHWTGCKAGKYTLGIESDGTVKGCPSLPTAPYAGGNVRDLSIAQIWSHAEALSFTRDRDVTELWGFCRTCYYADTCRAGCSFTAHCTLGRRGNMPFCYHRATQLKRQGLRERLVPVEAAAGVPYDFGRFELVEEPWPA